MNKLKEMRKITMRLPAAITPLNDVAKYIGQFGDTEKMKMVEIGVFYGDSTKIWVKYFKKIIAIDPWKDNIGDISNSCDMSEVFEVFKLELADHLGEGGKVRYKKAFSHEVVGLFKNRSLDFVYVDGMHTYEAVKKDIGLYLPKVKQGGFIGGHDYRRKFPGVIKAVNEMAGKPDRTFKDSSWIVRKA